MSAWSLLSSGNQFMPQPRVVGIWFGTALRQLDQAVRGTATDQAPVWDRGQRASLVCPNQAF